MGRLTLIVAVLALSYVSLSAGNALGGSTDVQEYMDRVKRVRRKKSEIQGYDAVGSTAGILGFLAPIPPYAVAVADGPLDSATYATATAQYGAIFQIPFLLQSYSFFTLKADNLKLTATQIAKIYLGNTTRWSSVQKGLKGAIIPVARSDGAGSTGVVTYFLSTTTRGFFPYVGNNALNSGVLPRLNKRMIFANGTFGMVQLVQQYKNALGYIATGYGLNAGLKECRIHNPAGNFVTAANADLSLAVPQTLPAPTADWSHVHLVNGGGANTYPIVEFVYSIWRTSYAGSPFNVPTIRNLKRYFEYINSKPGQTLGDRRGYHLGALPEAVYKGNAQVVRQVID